MKATDTMNAIAPLAAPQPPVTVITPDHSGLEAYRDLWEGLRRPQVWWTFALHETRQRFKRSVLGPLWITLTMGIMVASMGLVFSTLFGQEIDKTLPHIAVGIICWGLLTGCINEGTQTFIGAENFIRNVPLPVSVHFYRMMARNLIIFGFNMAIYIVLLAWFRFPLNFSFVEVIPGFALFLGNAAWMGLIAGVLSTRYRDIPQVITNAVQVIFFVTPVFWSPESLPKRPAFVDWNPLYHVLELVRAPLLGYDVPPESWLFALVLLVVGAGLTALVWRRAYARIAYWV